MIHQQQLADLLHAQIEGFLNYTVSTEELTRWAFETDSQLPFFINAPLDTAGYILFLEKITDHEDELRQYELRHEPVDFLTRMLAVLNEESVWEEAMHVQGQVFNNAPEGSVSRELQRLSSAVQVDPKRSYSCRFKFRVNRSRASIQNVEVTPI